MRYAFFILLILFVITPADAGFYKWVDSSGVVHYSDSLPPSSAYKSERIRKAAQPNIADQESALIRLQRDRAEIAAMRQRIEAIKAQEAAAAAAAPENALRAKRAELCATLMKQTEDMAKTGKLSGMPDYSKICY